jgi:hypothetical protein
MISESRKLGLWVGIERTREKVVDLKTLSQVGSHDQASYGLSTVGGQQLRSILQQGERRRDLSRSSAGQDSGSSSSGGELHFEG